MVRRIGCGHKRNMPRTVAVAVATVCVVVGVSACAPPKLAPLKGVQPENAVLPKYELPDGARRVTFKWELNEGEMVVRGDGVARMASPDSARVDLVIGGGFGGASASIIGDSVRFPSRAMMTHLVPSTPVLWAALGRLALPALTDTAIRVVGDTLRADLGSPVRWRVTSVGAEFRRLDRIVDGRIVESIERVPGKTVRYEAGSRRWLTMTIVDDAASAPFESSIWRF